MLAQRLFALVDFNKYGENYIPAGLPPSISRKKQGKRTIATGSGRPAISKELRRKWASLPVMPGRIVFFQKSYGELLRSHGCLLVVVRFQINAAGKPANIGEMLFEFVFDWALH